MREAPKGLMQVKAITMQIKKNGQVTVRLEEKLHRNKLELAKLFTMRLEEEN